jgi:hypothetical protein
MIAGMTKTNALRAQIGGETHLQILLTLEEADLKPDGMLIVQSGSRKIRRQVATRLAHALGRSVYEIGLAKFAEEHAEELGETLEPLVAGAAMRGAMLFLDEADALFGNRHGDVAKILRALTGDGVFVVAGTVSYARADRFWAEHLIGVLFE